MTDPSPCYKQYGTAAFPALLPVQIGQALLKLGPLDDDPDYRANYVTLTTGTKLGRYEICSKIGEGGMGEVYLAKDATLHRRVAIKREFTDSAP